MTTFQTPHTEQHKSHRAPWLRAAILGADDGIVSTSALVLGVFTATADKATILTAGIAGLVAGAMSMAVGEYVSVSSQRDSERADIDIEKRSLADNPKEELAELTHIYVERGLDAKLARQVAEQLHAKDAVGAHARDELGIDHEDLSNPLQAAFTSALAFTIGALVPVLAAVVSPESVGAWIIVIASLIMLAISGAIGAVLGGGSKVVAAARVFFGGGAAMAVTAAIGHLVGIAL